MNSFYATPLILILALALNACKQSPLRDIQHNPLYTINIVTGEGFMHRTIEKHPSSPVRAATLHIYIEGDGRPWWTRTQVALDPTPHRLPVLKLMEMDPNASLYVGRPCYLSVKDPACSPIWWTHQRYSEEIVASMNRVLDNYTQHYDVVRLIGHSGGGTLAMLIAARRNDIDAVITLAGNLDIVAWANHHQYSPLTKSLNPIDYPLPRTTRQLHFIGSKDSTIPIAILQQSINKIGRGSITMYKDIDHLCCWQKYWPDILNKL